MNVSMSLLVLLIIILLKRESKLQLEALETVPKATLMISQIRKRNSENLPVLIL